MALLSHSRSSLLGSPSCLSGSALQDRGHVWILDSDGEVVQALVWTQNGWRELTLQERTKSLVSLASGPQRWAETAQLPGGQFLVRFCSPEEN